ERRVARTHRAAGTHDTSDIEVTAMNRCTPILLAALAAGAAPAPVAAQPLGPFQWQLAPYCNVLTLAVTGTAGAYRVEGIDDQCGTRAASVAGVASLNADGSVALGMSIVTTPGGRPVHVRATLDSATLTGTWRDSLGNS